MWERLERHLEAGEVRFEPSGAAAREVERLRGVVEEQVHALRKQVAIGKLQSLSCECSALQLQ